VCWLTKDGVDTNPEIPTHNNAPFIEKPFIIITGFKTDLKGNELNNSYNSYNVTTLQIPFKKLFDIIIVFNYHVVVEKIGQHKPRKYFKKLGGSIITRNDINKAGDEKNRENVKKSAVNTIPENEHRQEQNIDKIAEIKLERFLKKDIRVDENGNIDKKGDPRIRLIAFFCLYFGSQVQVLNFINGFISIISW
jgi:hypothetical protein